MRDSELGDGVGATNVKNMFRRGSGANNTLSFKISASGCDYKRETRNLKLEILKFESLRIGAVW